MKKEEAAAKYALNNERKGSWNDIVLSCFEAGANWQAERDKAEAIRFAKWLLPSGRIMHKDGAAYTIEELYDKCKKDNYIK